MGPDQFAARREPQWTRLESLLAKARRRAPGLGQLGPSEVWQLSKLYRGLAADLMWVKRERFGSEMELRLERLASEAHRLLHKGQASRQSGLLSQLLDFPGAVRRNRAWVLIALGLFYGTTLVGGLLAWFDQVYAEAILGPQQVLLMEDMYGEAAVRSVEANLTMTGFYVFNNVGIAFRCFATGFLLGIGPIFYMVFNGLNLGAVAGHLVRIGAGGNIGAFVVSHAPWELTAIGLAGAAGLQMGWAVIAPGRHTRLGRLRRVGPELMRQVLGIAAFLLVAALIEGLWSATSAPAWVKLSCGIVGAVLVGWILIFSGRRRPLPEDVRDG